MNWGKAIVLVYILFAGFIGTLVYLMCRQRVDLVRDDYYQTEIAFQQQIDRVARTAKLAESPTIHFDASRQVVELTRSEAGSTSGKLTFYRPSDRRQDRSVALQPGQTTVSTAKLASGFWRVQLNWLENGQEYYSEQTVTIP
ncbi:FixH family protein [Larkinella punicea]|uniref:Nitrogen fixation protein FixH n=1 Tax=Larkinella punicea TaxID=2315727 RepID=A0A368JGG9_9BACT|nr:FixH family protein [Larkinella punicea]RCR66759.1 nitrogen fixation protein FixH [Larkinella punicea]